MRNFCLLFLSLVLSQNIFSQQLMINEVSQGSGASEYVEFVVIGSPICEGVPIPCIDIRKVIFDDNNGFFQLDSTTQTGIASGALRFSNDPFWSCIPQGTYIVIYNDASPNAALPPDDSSVNDGNCTIILPGNSPLLESTSVSPSVNNSLYPTNDSDWVPSIGWAAISMNNSNDSFQIPNLGSNGTPLHSVSWGNNVDGVIISFPGSVSGMVMSFENINSNDFNDQVNWVIEDVAVGQTPGAANSTANDLWIGTMNPTCRVNPALSFAITNSDCSSSNGSITLTIANSTNSSILWEGGQNTATISNLAQGTYSVTVTDNLTGCIFVDSAAVGLNNSTLAVNPAITDETCSNLCDGTVNLNITGGQTPYTQNWFQNGVAITQPTTFCAGTFDVQISDANNCQINETILINTATIVSYTISNDTLICLGDTISLFVNGVSNVLWSNLGETTTSIFTHPDQSSTINVTLTENSCVINESILVSVQNCDFAIDFPNVFTPNGDNVNDNYVPIAFSGITNQEFVILNRWGNIVYETTAQTISWDGKVDGKEASEGVYFYKLIYKGLGEEAIILHGFLHLERK